MRGDRRSPSFWASVFRKLRLAWRLFWDRRVPAAYKLVPVATLLYLLSPIDFLPDWLLGLGQLDDVGVFLLGLQVFTRIVPRSILDRILSEMDGNVVEGEWRRSDRDSSEPAELPKSNR